MFLFEYDNTKHFRDLIEALKVVAEENPVMFKLDREGLAARQFDMAQQTMFDFSLPSSAFNKWNVEGTMEILVDLNLFDTTGSLRKAETFEETMDYYKKARMREGSA